MGRQRRRINQGIPKYCYRKRGNWVYRKYLGIENGVRQYEKDVHLCPVDSPMSALFAAYEKVTQQVTDSLRWLLSEYHASQQFRKLKPRTQADYESYRTILTGRKLRTGVFGDVKLHQIKKTTIRNYLDTYKGGKAPIAANRHIQYLKAAWNWAEQRYDYVPVNPCTGVRLNEQVPRQRYVTQDEFFAFKAVATPYIGLFMDLAYLCRARWSEVAGLKRNDLLPEGIRLVRSKGSEGEITAWTPRLEAVVAECRAFNQNAPAPISGAYLIHDSKGAPIKQNAFQSAWGRAMRKYATDPSMRFTFHDLKAAGYSDQLEQSAGHKSDKMHKTYSRKLRIVQPAE